MAISLNISSGGSQLTAALRIFRHHVRVSPLVPVVELIPLPPEAIASVELSIESSRVKEGKLCLSHTREVKGVYFLFLRVEVKANLLAANFHGELLVFAVEDRRTAQFSPTPTSMQHDAANAAD